MRTILLTVGFTLMLAAAIPLRAQSGCDDSPEDPTIVLALVGATGGFVGGVWRSRSRNMKSGSKQQ